MSQFLRMEDVELSGKTVLVRADLNVPMQGSLVTDNTRIARLKPTIDYLLSKDCKIVLLSHFARPEGKFVPSMSLAPLVDAVSAVMDGREIKFGVDCVGTAAKEAVAALKPGDIILMENLRFHPQEEKGDKNFAQELASLGDVYVNDAFSASHRAHASISGVADFIPVVAGRLMQQEVEILTSIFSGAEKPIGAIIGGSKISTKLELLGNLTKTMDVLAIGGAMANTFLYAQGFDIGKSICEKNMKDTALKVLADAKAHDCHIVLPVDMVVTCKFEPQALCQIVDIDRIPENCTATDIGPFSTLHFARAFANCKTVIWNGPVGAFETSPFDTSTVQLARMIAKYTREKKLRSIAGGGDTVSAMTHSGLASEFTYLSTAGGAFLEWLEGKELPGVAALNSAKNSKQKLKA